MGKAAYSLILLCGCAAPMALPPKLPVPTYSKAASITPGYQQHYVWKPQAGATGYLVMTIWRGQTNYFSVRKPEIWWGPNGRGPYQFLVASTNQFTVSAFTDFPAKAHIYWTNSYTFQVRLYEKPDLLATNWTDLGVWRTDAGYWPTGQIGYVTANVPLFSEKVR